MLHKNVIGHNAQLLLSDSVFTSVQRINLLFWHARNFQKTKNDITTINNAQNILRLPNYLLFHVIWWTKVFGSICSIMIGNTAIWSYAIKQFFVKSSKRCKQNAANFCLSFQTITLKMTCVHRDKSISKTH